MISNLQAPMFFGLIAAFMTTLGLLAVALRSDWSLRYAGLFGLAAAGMLCAMTFLHILPEAFALTETAPTWLALGFFGGLVLNFSIQTVFPERATGGIPREALTPIVAIGLHSFIDGIVYAVTFAASFSSGVYAAMSLILHEFPEGVIAFAILRRYGVTNRMAFVWAFIAAAITTPLGVLVAGPFMYGLGQSLIGTLFALSAGLLLYVATGPLMAPLKEVEPHRGLAALMLGVGVAVGLMSLPLQDHDHGELGHSHAHESHSHPLDQPDIRN